MIEINENVFCLYLTFNNKKKIDFLRFPMVSFVSFHFVSFNFVLLNMISQQANQIA